MRDASVTERDKLAPASHIWHTPQSENITQPITITLANAMVIVATYNNARDAQD